MLSKPKNKGKREEIKSISNSHGQYFIVYDNLYKPVRCELEFARDYDIDNVENFVRVHKLFKKYGFPVMSLEKRDRKSVYFQLYGGYKTLETYLREHILSPQKIYSQYILILNATWYYLSKRETPDYLPDYFDGAKSDALKHFNDIMEFITERKVDREVLTDVSDEFDKLLAFVKKMPKRLAHGGLTVSNILMYHDTFVAINNEHAMVAPYLYDFVMLVTDMCHKFGDDFEMVFVKDYYELSLSFLKDEIRNWEEGDYFLSYKVMQLLILLHESFNKIYDESVSKEHRTIELRKDMKKMKKYSRKYSEFHKIWDIFTKIVEG